MRAEPVPRRRSRPRSLAALLVLLLILLHGTVSSSALQALEVGMEGPDFSLQDLNGTVRRFSELQGGKLTAVVFWATWAGNSARALQQLQQLQLQYREAGFAVIAVNVDRQEMDEAALKGVKAFVASHKLDLPVLVDRGLAVFGSYGVIAVPTTVILDKERIIRHELSGFPLLGSAGQKQFVEAALGAKAAPAAVAAGPQPDKKAVRLWNMGLTTLRSERTAPRAKGWFEQAIVADPAFVLPYISLGELYRKEGNLAEARRQFELALQRKPDQVVALASLGQVLLQQGDLAGADEKLTRAVKADDSYLPTYYLLGLLKGRQGAQEQATAWFEKAEQLNPRDYRIHLHKGMLFEERHDPAAAAAAYHKALGLIIGMP